MKDELRGRQCPNAKRREKHDKQGNMNAMDPNHEIGKNKMFKHRSNPHDHSHSCQHTGRSKNQAGKESWAHDFKDGGAVTIERGVRGSGACSFCIVASSSTCQVYTIGLLIAMC